MSYSSRVYRQRNAHTNDEKKNDAFFGKQHDESKTKSGKSFFQAKLSVNKPGDQYEKEADSVANAVVNKSTPGPVAQQKKISSVQRLSTPAEDEKLGTNDARMQKDKEIQEKPIQTKGEEDQEKKKMKSVQKMDDPEREKKKPLQKMDDPEKEKKKPLQKMDDPEKEKKKPLQKMDDPEKEKKKPVQTKQDSHSGVASPGVSSKIENSAGKGKRLPGKTLNEMNTSFGKDFSDVTIHNDQESSELNKELNAQAFTHGKDIYFNEGKFDEGSSQGKNLLAHELTHVVQQNSD